MKMQERLNHMAKTKTIKERLNRIRTPKQCSVKNAIISAALFFVGGIALGIIAKWLDNLALDSTIWWHRLFETMDLGNFFSDFAIWLLIALVIAAFSPSALRAAFNVFVFFAGMCVAYHAYTVLFSGFNPSSYMMIWYGVTLLSPILAVLCWYAKGTGTVPVIIDIAIITVFSLSCFAIGLFYISFRGVLYFLVFAGVVVVLYRDPKQLLISLPAGFLLSFLISPIWPYR
ncbi:hypothetical protein SAMN02910327_00153 [Peptostreptococcaceae bacterium pGA-8]|nr:hypothetical protein SAMN02910327_00153 [Peptostreptococcaceae bacterium pGA-8]